MKEIEFEHKGMKCWVIYIESMGHRCGYIELPEGHSWLEYDDLTWTGLGIEVHGGITFHVGRVVGFDCAHSSDAPSEEWIKQRSQIRRDSSQYLDWLYAGGTHKSLNFCIEECKNLADQADAANTGH